MQDNINNSINNNLSNVSPGKISENMNSVSVPTSNLAGEITINKNSLYIKIFIFIILFLIIAGVLAYVLLPKNKTSILPDGGNSFPSLNLGTNLGGETYTNSSDNSNTDNLSGVEGDDDLKEVSHIWPKSIAGYTIIENKIGTSTENFVLFMDKISGNIYKTFYPSLENTRLTNTTVQDVSVASFSKNADFVAILSGNGPYYKLETSRLSSESDQSFSPSEIDKNVLDLYSSGLDNIFYYIKAENNNSASILSFAPSSGRVSLLTDLKFSDIFISGEDAQNIYISSKPSLETKQLTAIINKKSNKLSYVKNANNNKYTLGGEIIKENLGLVSVSDLDTLKSNNNLTLESFADKCTILKSSYLACGTDENFPEESRVLDSWNKGIISFTDTVSILKLSDGEKTFIPVSLISGEPLDIYNANSSENFFTFQNKNDDSLWLVDLIGL